MRKNLSPKAIYTNIKDQVASVRSDTVQEFTKTVAENPVVVVGVRYNPAVSKICGSLKQVVIDLHIWVMASIRLGGISGQH